MQLYPIIKLRWDGAHGVAVHGNTTKKIVSPLTIGGVEFEQIDLAINTDGAGIQHTYCWVMEPGSASGRPATIEETAEMVRRLNDMAACASYALRRTHGLRVRWAEYLEGIWQAVSRFPKERGL